MFDFVHERKRLVQIVLLLIILPFAFWGVDSYRKAAVGSSLASVNGEKITEQEFENALRQQEQRMRAMSGPAFDASVFEKPEVRFSILNTLVTQHLLDSEASRLGLATSADQVRSVINGIAAFQKDGKFDRQQYEKTLAAQNMSPAYFEEKVRQELNTRQLTDSYLGNGFASDAVMDRLIHLNEQQRVMSVADLDLKSYMGRVHIAPESIDEYYKNNQNEFKTPEKVKVEYLMLSPDALSSQVQVSDADVKDYFTEHQAEFATPEQRQASHILISITPHATDAEKQAAKAKAEEVLQQVRQTPGSFAALAKKYSQDPGSAANGGDLGYFGRGAMVKPFEDAVYALKPGEISGLVQSDFGYHIIKLTGIRPGKTQSFSEVKSLIAQRLKAQKASDQFADLADKFSNTVYEQSDSLKPAAELTKQQIQQGGWLVKGSQPAGIWTDKVMQALFADDAIKNKRNTAAIEVSPNVLVSARVVEYQAASVKALADVKDAIQNKLMQQQALAEIAKAGEAALGRLRQGEKVDLRWQPAKTITRSQHPGVDVDVAQAVFRENVAKLPAYVGVESAANGYVLVRVDAVKDIASVDDEKRKHYAQQVAQITGEEILQAYLADARKHADINIKSFAVGDNK